MTMLQKYLDEIIENQTKVIEALKEADHFYICHFCKKRDQIEHRRCYWDEKSKIWETKDGKIAFTVLAMDLDETEIVGYRTFVNVFNVTGRVAKFPTSEAVQ
jgi:hypothetical protein